MTHDWDVNGRFPTLIYCHGARLVMRQWLHGSSNTLSNTILNGPVFNSCKLTQRILRQSHFYLYSHHPEKFNHQLVPNDIKVCGLWRVQVEQRGHVIWRLRRGYVPRDNMKPGVKNGKTNIEQQVAYKKYLSSSKTWALNWKASK